ncbi:MAG: SU10 major capsid protein [Rhodoglobus sp.]
MSGITGIGTTFNLPNYHGELFQISPTDTPLLSLSGGLGGGKQTDSPAFEWQTEDLRDPEIRPRLEGAAAPTAESRVRANVENVVQIFHEAVETSYTKQAATGQYATPASAPFYSASGEPNPINAEHAHQVVNALKTIARDVNFSFWHGRLVKPTTNATARATRGLLQAITTNRVAVGEILNASAATDTITGTHALAVNDRVVFTDVGVATAIRVDRAYWVQSVSTTVSFKVSATQGGAAIVIGTATVSAIKAGTTLTVDALGSLMQGVFDNGGISESGTATLFTPSRQKLGLTKAYASAYGATNALVNTRDVGGFSVDTIVTDFGTMNVVIDRALPPDALVVASLEQIEPVFLSVPGKGVLFEEELAKVGASDRSQIYGEIGLKYGSQLAHGVIRGLAV